MCVASNLPWSLKSEKAIGSVAAIGGIPHSAPVALVPVGSCFNPMSKNETSDTMRLRLTVWIHQQFVWFTLISVELRMIAVSTCRRVESSNQKTRFPRLNAATPLQLACLNSARVKFHDGRLSFIIISSAIRLFLRRILKPTKSNIIRMATRHQCFWCRPAILCMSPMEF